MKKEEGRKQKGRRVNTSRQTKQKGTVNGRKEGGDWQHEGWRSPQSRALDPPLEPMLNFVTWLYLAPYGFLIQYFSLRYTYDLHFFGACISQAPIGGLLFVKARAWFESFLFRVFSSSLVCCLAKVDRSGRSFREQGWAEKRGVPSKMLGFPELSYLCSCQASVVCAFSVYHGMKPIKQMSRWPVLSGVLILVCAFLLLPLL